MAQPEAEYKTTGGQQDYTPSAAVVAGEIVTLPDGRAGVVKSALAASAKGAVYTKGNFDVKAPTGTTFSIGDPVYWDHSAATAIIATAAAGVAATAADLYLGRAAAAKASGVLVVRVDLNAGEKPPRAATIAHDNTADHYLIDAADNKHGLVVEAFLALVEEAPAGSSEDQMVVTLYDSDDNALATLTTTNTTPDAAGDVIVGTLSLYAATTGVVLCVIPADKGAYAKVSQATAGTPAGELRVWVMTQPVPMTA